MEDDGSPEPPAGSSPGERIDAPRSSPASTPGYELRERRLTLAELRDLRDRPHEVLRRVAEEGGDVIALRAGPARAFFLVHPDAVQHVLQARWRDYSRATFQYRLLSSVAGFGVLTLDGPEWLFRRRLAQPAFHRHRIAEHAGRMREAAYRVGEGWADAADRGEPVDVLHGMSRYALDVLGSTLLGSAAGTAEVRDTLVRATEQVLEHIMARSRTLGLVPTWAPTPAQRRYRKARRTLDSVIHEAIGRARRGQNGGDLLSLLLDPRADPPLSDRQLRDELATFLIAGHETVASALAWTWFLLATDDAVHARALEHARQLVDPAAPSPHARYLRWTFREALRLYPPAWLTTRRALADDCVCGQPISAGALVVLSPYATQRSSRLWPDPDSFDPERWSGNAPRHRYADFPFGGGPHLCIGNHFALLEGVVALATLLPIIRLEPPVEPVVAEPGVTLRPRGGLPMRPYRR